MRKTVWIAVALSLVSALGFAWLRASASYRLGPDGVTGGGGPSTSVSYVAAQQAVGETAGLSVSTSYRNRAGVVQPIPIAQGELSGWEVF